jgi:hypothetical protein
MLLFLMQPQDSSQTIIEAVGVPRTRACEGVEWVTYEDQPQEFLS